MNTQSKVAIITGASHGIGAYLVQGYLNLGYQIVANSLNIKQGDSLNVLAVDGDIADPRTAERIAGMTLEWFGRIDSLVNNAGVFIPNQFFKYSEEDFAKLVAMNLGGVFHISQKVARQMLKQGSGHIVNITTTLADQPLIAVPAALASLTKRGLNAVTKSLAVEYAGKGVRVNAVSPGTIKTPMDHVENYSFPANLHPMRRMGQVQEVVDAVLYLETAALVTGEILYVDDGRHASQW